MGMASTAAAAPSSIICTCHSQYNRRRRRGLLLLTNISSSSSSSRRGFFPSFFNLTANSGMKPSSGRLQLCITNSTEAAADQETTTTTEQSSSPVMEVPEGPPSLISSLNVHKALRGIAITDADHYGRLGLQRGCSYDQVTVAYKNKVDELMGEGLEGDELNEKLEHLKESYRVMSSVEERRLYDWSLARKEKPDSYKWPFEVDLTQIPRDDQSPPPQEPEDVGPTRLVGYFMLAWLLLGFTLSIALNR